MFTRCFLAQQTLNNDSVVKLMKAGFSEDLIITTINRSQGSYDTSVDGLIALKNAGMTNKEIAAIVAKASPQTSAALVVPVAESAPTARAAPTARTALAVPAQSANKPRVFLRAQSHSSGWNESRDQSMEMSKDFQEVCPGVQISLNQHLVDYTVELNHIEHDFLRDNQMQVANRDGDLVSRTKGGGSIKGGVKKVWRSSLRIGPRSKRPLLDDGEAVDFSGSGQIGSRRCTGWEDAVLARAERGSEGELVHMGGQLL